jgi:Flp pilus assembly protein TadG
MGKPLLSLRHFSRNKDGAAALEFALLLPLFLILYLCVVEFCQAFMVQRRAHHSASMMADIVAQAGSVTTQDLSDFFAVGGLIMMPFSDEPLEGRVSSIKRGADGRARVEWSHGSKMTRHAVGAVITIPNNLIPTPGDSLIYAETVYKYDSPFDIKVPGFPDYLEGVTTFRREFYLRPREVASVSCTNCPKT